MKTIFINRENDREDAVLSQCRVSPSGTIKIFSTLLPTTQVAVCITGSKINYKLHQTILQSDG